MWMLLNSIGLSASRINDTIRMVLLTKLRKISTHYHLYFAKLNYALDCIVCMDSIEEFVLKIFYSSAQLGNLTFFAHPCLSLICSDLKSQSVNCITWQVNSSKKWRHSFYSLQSLGHHSQSPQTLFGVVNASVTLLPWY